MRQVKCDMWHNTHDMWQVGRGPHTKKITSNKETIDKDKEQECENVCEQKSISLKDSSNTCENVTIKPERFQQKAIKSE